jgi:hypothetical protein
VTTSFKKIDPLNPVLYGLLQHKFGAARIHNQGCAAQPEFVRDTRNPSRLVEVKGVSGEYYAVCCPFCSDQGYRLWVNYRYGSTTDAHTGRREKTYLAHCYHKNCLSVPGRRTQLEDLIFGQHRRGIIAPPIVHVDADVAPPPPITPPGDIVSLTELSPDHPALAYLRSRNFDPADLAVNYSVGFCTKPAAGCYLMQQRIYIPVIARKQLIGWQGRAISDTVSPKYYNSRFMQKSRTLYNFDTASQQPYAVVVEGVPSVWRIGAAGVCLFGKTMSHWQCLTLATTWAHKPIFLLLDHDAAENTEQCYRELCRHDACVVPVFLPDARDPADYTREELSTILNATAAAVGVDVTVHL